jgi:hypothetical protein
MTTKLDSKKIAGVIKQLENAGKAAVKALNEMTDGGYRESPLEKDPFGQIGVIGGILQQAREQATLLSKYEGMDEAQIAAAQTAEREAEKETLQQAMQERLASRQPKEPAPDQEPEGDAVQDSNPDNPQS